MPFIGIPMIADQLGQTLHHRATTGEHLGPEEHAQLTEWYAAKDHEESLLLLGKPAPALMELQTKIDVAVQELMDINKKNLELRRTNAVLQAEIVVLKKQLAAKTPLQPV